MLGLEGAEAYIYGPSVMNKVCEQLYSNSTYGKARSINIDDVNSVLGWTDTRGMVVDNAGSVLYKVKAGTKFGDVGQDQMAQADWDILKNNNDVAPESGKKLTDYKLDGYHYYIEDAQNATTLAKQTVLTPVLGCYWLASRGAMVQKTLMPCYDPMSGMINQWLTYVDAIFGAYVVHHDAFEQEEQPQQQQQQQLPQQPTGGSGLFNTFSTGQANPPSAFGLRPVVPLKSNLPQKIQQQQVQQQQQLILP